MVNLDTRRDLQCNVNREKLANAGLARMHPGRPTRHSLSAKKCVSVNSTLVH